MAMNTYAESEAVKKAQEMLQQQLASKPGAYQSQWQTQLDDAIGKILNREKFSYDLNGDALYQQYKNQYQTQGQLAMMDTMGQAQAMTGGYGNSYAQTAGQQVYQGYLQQLNDKVPELYSIALDKYNQDGQDMYNQYSLLADQENQAYSKYVDDRNMQYQQIRDSVADSQWQAEFNEAVRQYNQKNSISTGSTGSTGGNTTTNPTGNPNPQPKPTGYDNGGLTTEQIKAIQKTLGVAVDGKWGPESQSTAKAMWGVTSAKDALAKLNSMNLNTGGTVTYSDVANTAAELKKKGASKNDIYQYISSMVNSSNYKPTTSVAQDLAELKSGYVGSGR